MDYDVGYILSYQVGYIILLAILAIIPAVLANRKGRSAFGFWIFGLAFLPIAIIVAAIMKPKTGYASYQSTKYKPAQNHYSAKSESSGGHNIVDDSNPHHIGWKNSSSMYYDGFGHRVGYTDNNGRHFDDSGHQVGYTDNNGRHYDGSFHQVGYTDCNGRIFDGSGHQIGHVDSNGRVFDSSGHQIGFTR